MTSFRVPHVLMLTAALATLAGCGDNPFPVARAKGKVICDGKPLTSGSISFSPIGKPDQLETGKPASATLGPDGTFVLSTFGRFDGAIVGKHSVQFTGGGAEDSEEGEESAEENPDAPAQKPKGKTGDSTRANADCVQRGEIIVEVIASGPNDFTIDLSASRK